MADVTLGNISFIKLLSPSRWASVRALRGIGLGYWGCAGGGAYFVEAGVYWGRWVRDLRVPKKERDWAHVRRLGRNPS